MANMVEKLIEDLTARIVRCNGELSAADEKRIGAGYNDCRETERAMVEKISRLNEIKLLCAEVIDELKPIAVYVNDLQSVAVAAYRLSEVVRTSYQEDAFGETEERVLLDKAFETVIGKGMVLV